MIRVLVSRELVSEAFVVGDEPDDGHQRWFRLKEGLPAGVTFHHVRLTAERDVELYFVEPGENLEPGAVIIKPKPRTMTPMFELRILAREP